MLRLGLFTWFDVACVQDATAYIGGWSDYHSPSNASVAGDRGMLGEIDLVEGDDKSFVKTSHRVFLSCWRRPHDTVSRDMLR